MNTIIDIKKVPVTELKTGNTYIGISQEGEVVRTAIEMPEGGNVDLTGYATEEYVQDVAQSVLDKSNAIQSDLNQKLMYKQDLLSSGMNIKTINGETLLGGGDITIAGGGSNILIASGETLSLDMVATAYEEGIMLYYQLDKTGDKGDYKAYIPLTITKQTPDFNYIYNVWGWIDTYTIINWQFTVFIPEVTGEIIEITPQPVVVETLIENGKRGNKLTYEDGEKIYNNQGNVCIMGTFDDNSSYVSKLNVLCATKTDANIYKIIATNGYNIYEWSLTTLGGAKTPTSRSLAQ